MAVGDAEGRDIRGDGDGRGAVEARPLELAVGGADDDVAGADAETGAEVEGAGFAVDVPPIRTCSPRRAVPEMP
jgi:hypothetical protein